MKKTFYDCYSYYNKNKLTIGNSLIEREIVFIGNYPISNYILNKTTNYKWTNNYNPKMVMFNLPIMDFSKASINIRIYTDNNDKLSNQFLNTEVCFHTERHTIKFNLFIYPHTPFITSNIYVKGESIKSELKEKVIIADNSDGVETATISSNTILFELPCEDTIDVLNINESHIKMEVIQFYDSTDSNNELVKQYEELLYPNAQQSFSGNIFITKNYMKNENLMIVKEGATINGALNRGSDDLIIRTRSKIELVGSGVDNDDLYRDEYVKCYGSTIGVGDDVERRYKDLYNQIYVGDMSENLFIMSNTWGDRSQDATVCEDFIIRELNVGEEIGIDIMQIDDGWQKGISSNSAVAKNGAWGNFLEFDRNFWDINTPKFPNGFDVISKYAKSKNIVFALWFAPDRTDGYAQWEVDANTMISLYEKYDVRYFKIDAICLTTKKSERNLINMFVRLIKESDHNANVNLDITNGVRFGYLYEKMLGTVFVENRYTDFRSYYPHYTLRNIWSMSKYIPLKRFQFEVLNNRRNKDKYPDDLLAPYNYTIDYTFAITMCANPLLWMEMSNLHKDDVALLTKIVGIYKKERKNIYNSDVLPIGERPDGLSNTGFQIICDDNSGYLLLFREFSEKDEYNYKLHCLGGKSLEIEILYTNSINCVRIDNKVSESNIIHTKISDIRSFVFVKYCVGDC